MKKIVLSLLVLFTTFNLVAQDIIFDIAGPIIEVGGPNQNELVVHGNFTNNTSETITVAWERKVEDFVDDNWRTLVCDKVTCWSPFTSENSFELAAGESSLLDVHFQGGGGSNLGESVGYAKLEVYNVANPGNRYVVEYYAVTSPPGLTFTKGESVHVQGTAGEFEIIAHGLFINTSTEPIELSWERTSESFDDSTWKSLVCDAETCWAPFTNTNTYMLNPGELSILDVHFQGEGGLTTGTGEVVLDVFATGNPEIGFSATYEASVFAVGIDDNEVKEEVKLYPNPVRDQLNIDMPVDAKIRHVEIFNLLGKQVGSYTIPNGYYTQAIETCDLTKGMYFVSLFDEKRDLVSTKVFSKVD